MCSVAQQMASKVLLETLPWWSKREPGYIIGDENDARAQQIKHEGLTGKVRARVYGAAYQARARMWGAVTG